MNIHLPKLLRLQCFITVTDKQTIVNTVFPTFPSQGGHTCRALTKVSFLWLCSCLVRKLRSHPKFSPMWWGLPLYLRKTICSECVLSGASWVIAWGCAFVFILAQLYEWISKAATGWEIGHMDMAPGVPLLKKTTLPVDSIQLRYSLFFLIHLFQYSTRILWNSL